MAVLRSVVKSLLASPDTAAAGNKDGADDCDHCGTRPDAAGFRVIHLALSDFVVIRLRSINAY